MAAQVLLTPTDCKIPLQIKDNIFVLETESETEQVNCARANVDIASLKLAKNKRKKAIRQYAGVYFTNEQILKWHRRMCHMDFEKLQKTLMFSRKGPWPKCSVCARAKCRRTAYQKIAEAQDETAPLQRVVCDLEGPYSVEGINGERYTQNFCDVYSKFIAIVCHRFKSESAENLEEFCEEFDPPLIIKTDRGGEFTGTGDGKWRQVCEKYNIDMGTSNYKGTKSSCQSRTRMGMGRKFGESCDDRLTITIPILAIGCSIRSLCLQPSSE